MSIHKYNYDIPTALPSGVDTGLLHKEIEDNQSITPGFDGIIIEEQDIEFRFDDELSAGEEVELESVMAAHVPTPEPFTDETEGNGYFTEVCFKQVKTESTTASKDDWKTKVSMTTKSLDEGTYRIGWSFLWGHSHTGSQFCARIKIDDIDVVIHESEPKDTGDYRYVSGFIYEALTAGVHVVSLEFRSSKNGKTTKMKNSNIELKKFREG